MPKKQTSAFDEKKKVLDYVNQCANNARTYSNTDFERFSRYYNLFRNKQVTKNYDGLANLFVPEPYRVIVKKTARLSNAIRHIEVTAEGPNDIPSAKIGSHLMNYLRRKMNWHMVERTAIQESRIVGLSWIKAVWLVDREEESKPWKGFDLSFESADRVLIDSDATILDVFQGTFRWLIHEYEADLNSLKANKNYDNLDVLALRGGGEIESTSLSQARIGDLNKPQKKNRKKFVIQEFWGKYGEEGKEKDYIIVIADKAVVLRNELNPYSDILDFPIPFVPFVANPVGKELYPVGDLEPAESLFNELNDTRNQRMDTVTLNIDPMKEVVKGANIAEADLITRRGGIIRSSIPGGIRFIPPDMQGIKAAIEEETVIRGDIQQVTGVINFAQGSDVQAGVNIDTARGTMIAKGEADVVTEDELMILKMSMKMLYRIVLAYAQSFLDRQFTMRVIENGAEAFYQVSKDVIQGNMDLDVEMKTLQDKTTDQQLKLMMFNQAKETPGANIGKFFTDVLEAFYENVNISEYYQQPQPQPPQPPSVSISLKGDLSSVEADEVFKTIPGVDPKAADPLYRQDLRDLMRGNHPEDHQKNLNEMEILKQQHDILNQAKQTSLQEQAQQNAGADTSQLQ